MAIGDFDSYPGSTFNSLAIRGDDVTTLTLRSIGIESDDWISLVEVSPGLGFVLGPVLGLVRVIGLTFILFFFVGIGSDDWTSLLRFSPVYYVLDVVFSLPLFADIANDDWIRLIEVGQVYTVVVVPQRFIGAVSPVVAFAVFPKGDMCYDRGAPFFPFQVVYLRTP